MGTPCLALKMSSALIVPSPCQVYKSVRKILEGHKEIQRERERKESVRGGRRHREREREERERRTIRDSIANVY
jgi:hypothetical protein